MSAPVEPEGKPPSERDPAAVLLQFVRAALQRSSEGDDRTFKKMVQCLSQQMNGPASTRWFTALGKCTSLISSGPSHRQLITVLLAYEWVNDQQAIDSYTSFLLSLVCTTCDFLLPCLGALVRKLLFYYEPTSDDEAAGVARATFSDPALVDKIHDGVHRLFAQIARIIPSTPTHLFPIIVRHFPHLRKCSQEHLVYLKNLLRISEYLPQLRDRLIELIAQKMILLDVELSDLDFVRSPPPTEPSVEYIQAGIVSNEAPDEDDMDDSSSIENEQATGHQSEVAEKLDQMMVMMLDYLQILRKSDLHICDGMFQSLLRVFESTILTTHDSEHTQYLMLFACSFKSLYAETALQRLLERVFDSAQSTPVRASCALYISSFVSEAAFLRRASVLYAFEVILKWVHAYEGLHSSPSHDQANDSHTVFYALCRCLFRIFTAHKEHFALMVEENDSLAEILRFQDLVQSHLNPLRFVDEQTMLDFATAVYSLRLANCYAVIRRNNAMLVSDFVQPQLNSNRSPFSSCRLHRTSVVVRPLLRHSRASSPSRFQL